MGSSSDRSPLLVCTACGKPQSQPTHLCEHCGAPLTPFAHTDPVLGIQSRGFALQKATTEPQKLIVVIGMWLWMFPMLVFGLLALCFGVYGALQGEPLAGLLVCTVGAGCTWISGTLLYRTTAGYRKGQQDDRAQSLRDADSNDDAEPVECLDCGQEFPADVDCCPDCGWSFSSQN